MAFIFKLMLLVLFAAIVNSTSPTGLVTQETKHLDSNSSQVMCGTASSAMTKEIWDAHTKVPWSAIVYLRTESQPDQIFAAVILSPTLVLTGADKVFTQGDKKLKLFASSHYQVRTNTTSFTDIMTTHIQLSHITHVRIHPKYSGLFHRDEWQTSHNNFVLVHLKDPIISNSEVHSACIPSVKQLDQILVDWDANVSSDVILVGWKRHVSESLALRMAPNSQAVCKSYWFGSNETSHAGFIDRICANVSSENTHTFCIHMGVGIFTKVGNRYYFTGLVNNFNSDNRACTPKALYYIEHVTPAVLGWIQQNKMCGPHHFTCNNGQCVLLDGVQCNRTAECLDGSDEDPIICRGFKYCNANEFPCGTYGRCLNTSLVCNGILDCEEGEDEINCQINGDSTLLVALLGAAGILMLLIIIAALVFWKKMKEAEEKLRNLTDDEVAEFEHGLMGDGMQNLATNSGPHVSHVYTNAPRNASNTTPEQFAWDGARYEIPKEQLKIDYETSLGSGMSGVVYKGVFEDLRGPTISKATVAVKTFKSSVDVQNFKSLLSELKIMTRVGKHENVVGLVGAYTREIKQRVLYMAVELCTMGDMEGFLKQNRAFFVNENQRKSFNKGTVQMTNQYQNREEVVKNNKTPFEFSDLLRWSYEIANGMEYLASLNITHGDLATRNILMTNDLTAKISDFGLARNLYESGIYVKKQCAPLPWRWMAVESLRDFEFSTNSDVWAYGVTLWEIYSLGGLPYPGLGWTNEFVTKLYEGLRMGKPSFATNKIYDQMMACWETIPARRPTFTGLKIFFIELRASGKDGNDLTTSF